MLEGQSRVMTMRFFASFFFKKKQKIAVWGWVPVSDDVSQKKLELTSNMTSATKTQIQNFPNSF